MKEWSAAGIGTVIAVTALASQAAEEVKWDAQGGWSAVLAVAAKEEQEVCTRLKPGQRVVWAFVAQSPLDFRIRDPKTKEVVSSSSRTGVVEARDALVPAREQDYCWAWINRGGQPTQVSLQLRQHSP